MIDWVHGFECLVLPARFVAQPEESGFILGFNDVLVPTGINHSCTGVHVAPFGKLLEFHFDLHSKGQDFPNLSAFGHHRWALVGAMRWAL